MTMARARSAHLRCRRPAPAVLAVCLATLVAGCSEHGEPTANVEPPPELRVGDRVLARDRTLVRDAPTYDAALAHWALPGAPGRLEGSERGTGGQSWWRVAFDEGGSGWVPEPDLHATRADAVRAFPTAEGFGAAARGGRGGRVIEVTSLNDDGPGSLRAALAAAGPRTVVFRVGGTIVLRSSIEILKPYLTIAGQTAPGGGIALRNHPSNPTPPIVIQTHNVVLRFLRIRPGPSDQSSCCLDALQIGRGAHQVIIDHASLSWGVDEIIDAGYDARGITLQWSIIAEGLNRSSHEKGRHSRGMLFGGEASGDYSIHHNLFAHNAQRNPLLSPGLGVADVVNNVIYNPQTLVSHVNDPYGPVRLNYVGNVFKAGPTTNYPTLPLYAVSVDEVTGGSREFSLFVAGNLDELHRPDDALPEDAAVEPEARGYVAASRHDAPLVRTTSAQRALEEVLAAAGATLPERDAVDARLVHEVRAASGKLTSHPDHVGGWPELASGMPPPDADHDGMADDWEMRLGLDPADPRDRNGDVDADGYTNLEDYLNELAGDVPPQDDGTS